MPSNEPADKRLNAMFYLGLFVSWAISALVSMTMAMLSINETIILAVGAGSILSLLAALAVGFMQKKRLAFAVAFTPILLLVGSALVLGILAGLSPG